MDLPTTSPWFATRAVQDRQDRIAIGTALLGRAHEGNARVRRAAADAWTAVENKAAQLMIHMPRRPWWSCRECQAAWPCEPAKAALGREMSPTALAIYMTVQMGEAIKDLPAAKPGALWNRFLAWTRDVRRP